MPITAMEAVILNEGIYPATLSGWEETEDTMGFGPGIKIIWNLDGLETQDGKPQDKWQYMSQKLTPRSNLWKFLKSFGNTPTLGQQYELDELLDPLVGVKANLVVKHEDTPNGPKAKVSDVLASGKVQAAPAPAADDVCCIPKCGQPVAKYDGDGNAFCEKHG